MQKAWQGGVSKYGGKSFFHNSFSGPDCCRVVSGGEFEPGRKETRSEGRSYNHVFQKNAEILW
jgi:hypothetical protein